MLISYANHGNSSKNISLDVWLNLYDTNWVVVPCFKCVIKWWFFKDFHCFTVYKEVIKTTNSDSSTEYI